MKYLQKIARHGNKSSETSESKDMAKTLKQETIGIHRHGQNMKTGDSWHT